MYKIIEKGTEYDIFTEDVISSLYEAITREIKKELKKSKSSNEWLIGSLALHDIPLMDGDNVNVWIGYNAKILPFGIVDAGIHECIIYDGIPDIILDKYNDIKGKVFKKEDTEPYDKTELI
jgi:hypothetical protein